MNTKKSKPATAQNITGSDTKKNNAQNSGQETEKEKGTTAIRKSPAKK